MYVDCRLYNSILMWVSLLNKDLNINKPMLGDSHSPAFV